MKIRNNFLQNYNRGRQKNSDEMIGYNPVVGIFQLGRYIYIWKNQLPVL